MEMAVMRAEGRCRRAGSPERCHVFGTSVPLGLVEGDGFHQMQKATSNLFASIRTHSPLDPNTHTLSCPKKKRANYHTILFF